MEKKKIVEGIVKGLTGTVALIVCAVGGYTIGKSGVISMHKQMSTGELLIYLGVLSIILFAAYFLQIVVHETGHLVCGLCSGYTFTSFRIGSFMWIREQGKIKLSRYSLAGTGGQCLMAPPEMSEGKIPYVLYNLGGPLFNGLLALLAFILYVPCRNIPYLQVCLLQVVLFGVVFGMLNGIPMKFGVPNDGYNAMTLGKDPEALRAFWVQMKVNAMLAEGVRIKDMPKEWFVIPSDEAMQNEMTSILGVLACNRLVDCHEFVQAEELMTDLLQRDIRILDLYRSTLKEDCIYCELMGDGDREKVEGWLDKGQQKYEKMMKRFPSVLRTQYTYALLAERDFKKAEEIEERFENVACTYPYTNEIAGERELMKLADHRNQICPSDPFG